MPSREFCYLKLVTINAGKRNDTERAWRKPPSLQFPCQTWNPVSDGENPVCCRKQSENTSAGIENIIHLWHKYGSETLHTRSVCELEVEGSRYSRWRGSKGRQSGWNQPPVELERVAVNNDKVYQLHYHQLVYKDTQCHCKDEPAQLLHHQTQISYW